MTNTSGIVMSVILRIVERMANVNSVNVAALTACVTVVAEVIASFLTEKIR